MVASLLENDEKKSLFYKVYNDMFFPIASSASILVILVLLCNNCRRRRTECSLVGTQSRTENGTLCFTSIANGDVAISYKPAVSNSLESNSIRLKGTTINRALPELPITSLDKTLDEVRNNEVDGVVIKHKLRRSNKPRAPLPPNIMNQCQEGISHCHSYARIKESNANPTENDTNDYCEPSTFVPINIAKDDVKNQNDDTYVGYSGLNRDFSPESSNLNTGQIDPSIEMLNYEPNPEISYNKISVREPLSTVLAERSLLEHHYTEVDEEGISSFYEEIAGSTASSVTYTKIGECKSESCDKCREDKCEILPPIPPSVKSLKEVAESSRSNSPSQGVDQIDSPSFEGCKDLYSFVDKSAKKSKTKEKSPNLDELYAKVQKGTKRKTSTAVNNNGEKSDAISRICCSENVLTRGAEGGPPPPPPILNMPSRSSRTVSMYDDRIINSLNSHERRHSSGTSNIVFGLDDGKSAIDEPGYEVVRYDVAGSDVEVDPGYEKIRMAVAKLEKTIDSDGPAEPGYEVVKYADDVEPCYEIIKREYQTSEPGYETINDGQITDIEEDNNYSRLKIERHESDVSTEPGYERVMFVRRNVNNSNEGDPTYASIQEATYDVGTLIERF